MQSEKRMENKSVTDIYVDFVQSSQLRKNGGESTGALGVLAGLAGMGVFLDATGIALFTYLIFGDEIVDAGGKLGKKFDRFRIKRTAKKEISMENMAGQEVSGRIDDVLALMVLQNEIMEIERDMRYSDNKIEKDEFNKRINALDKKMRTIRPNVKVEFGSDYKIITSIEEIKNYKLQDYYKALKDPKMAAVKSALKKAKKPKS